MANRRLEVARQAVDAALVVGVELGLDVSVVCVDSSGQVIASARHDLAAYPTLEIARKKAATAASLRMPTAVVARFVSSDPIAALALHAHPDMLAVPGGAPLFLDGSCIGGIGLAGASYMDDQGLLERVLGRLAAGEDAKA